MVLIIRPQDHRDQAYLLRRIFRLRYEEFVERLKWPLPRNDDRLERDQFDTRAATYLAALLPNGDLGACARLLPTTGPFMLSTVFADSLFAPAPSGPATMEGSRFCVSFRDATEEQSLELRAAMYAGLYRYCRAEDVTRVLIFTYASWVASFVRCGFHIDALGLPRMVDGIECLPVALTVSADQQDFFERYSAVRASLARSLPALRPDRPSPLNS